MNKCGRQILYTPELQSRNPPPLPLFFSENPGLNRQTLEIRDFPLFPFKSFTEKVT